MPSGTGQARTLLTARVGSACLAFLTILGGAPPAVLTSDVVDCSDKFPVGSFALTRNDVASLVGKMDGFSPVYISRKSVPVKPSGAGAPCEFVYGFDVFEFTDQQHPGRLVAGCRGDLDGDGERDYVVLLRRRSDAVKVAYAFLARAGTFQVIEVGLYGDPPAWSGPYCSPRPRTGIFEAPDFEGRGHGERVRVFGDLVTMGWSTYYWRPDLGRFEAILTTD